MAGSCVASQWEWRREPVETKSRPSGRGLSVWAREGFCCRLRACMQLLNARVQSGARNSDSRKMCIRAQVYQSTGDVRKPRGGVCVF
eukprot:4296128-Pleurochrysis_carterae.AAC.1